MWHGADHLDGGYVLLVALAADLPTFTNNKASYQAVYQSPLTSRHRPTILCRGRWVARSVRAGMRVTVRRRPSRYRAGP